MKKLFLLTGTIFTLFLFNTSAQMTGTVQLSDFTAVKGGDGICDVAWTTSTQEYCTTFMLCRTKNSSLPQEINTTPGVDSFTTGPKSYTYTDNGSFVAGDVIKYVLKFEDNWGNTFNIDSVTKTFTGLNDVINVSSGMNLYPNPVVSGTEITIDIIQLKHWNLSLIDAAGKLCYTWEGAGNQSIKMDKANFQNGIYFLQLHNGSNAIAIRKLIIN